MIRILIFFTCFQLSPLRAANLGDSPPEVVQMIFPWLEVQDILTVRQVNHWLMENISDYRYEIKIISSEKGKFNWFCSKEKFPFKVVSLSATIDNEDYGDTSYGLNSIEACLPRIAENLKKISICRFLLEDGIPGMYLHIGVEELKLYPLPCLESLSIQEAAGLTDESAKALKEIATLQYLSYQTESGIGETQFREIVQCSGLRSLSTVIDITNDWQELEFPKNLETLNITGIHSANYPPIPRALITSLVKLEHLKDLYLLYLPSVSIEIFAKAEASFFNGLQNFNLHFKLSNKAEHQEAIQNLAKKFPRWVKIEEEDDVITISGKR